MRIRGIPLILALTVAGCDSVGTFVNATGDIVSGRSTEAVVNAQRQQDAAINENSTLRRQLAALDVQKSALHRQLMASQEQLRTVSQQLQHENGATQEQRSEFNRLLDKQLELQRRLSAASAAPPEDTAAAANQRQQLESLTEEKDILERQVNALQRAL
jgi:chromosome segregation ATPase